MSLSPPLFPWGGGWRSEDSLQGAFLAIYLVGSENQACFQAWRQEPPHAKPSCQLAFSVLFPRSWKYSPELVFWS